MQNLRTPVIAFAARSGSGKTTLIEKVIKQLKTDGYRIAAIKHDAHQFDIDQPGKDTRKMAEAGADVVVISSSDKLAIIEKVAREKNLDELIAMLPHVDVILVEGFKKSGKPTIEVFRSTVNHELLSELPCRLAIASDITWEIGVPCYHIDDVDGVVSEIKKHIACKLI